jgi:ribulose bisphosphate carboxylase small subunit
LLWSYRPKVNCGAGSLVGRTEMSYDDMDEDYEEAVESQPETPAVPLPLPEQVEVKFAVYTRQMQDAILSNVAVQVEKLFHAKVEDSIESAVAALVEQISREHIETAVRASIAEGWTITNEYGEARGKATLKDRISKILEHRDQYSSRGKWAENIVREETEKALKGELKAELDAARAQFRAEVDRVLQAKLAEALRLSLGLGA